MRRRATTRQQPRGRCRAPRPLPAHAMRATRLTCAFPIKSMRTYFKLQIFARKQPGRFATLAGLLNYATKPCGEFVSDPTALITKDGRFSYEAAGDADLLPLIFLHGIGGAARGWRRQLTAFGDRYRAIAWDMPGYGDSRPLPAVSIVALADALQD